MEEQEQALFGLMGVPIGVAVGYLIGRHSRRSSTGWLWAAAILGWVLIAVFSAVLFEIYGLYDPKTRGTPPGTFIAILYFISLFPSAAIGKARRASDQGSGTDASSSQIATKPDVAATKASAKPASANFQPGGSSKLGSKQSGGDGSSQGDTDDLDLYSQVAAELERKEIDQGLWLKARIQASKAGLETELVYAELRLAQLQIDEERKVADQTRKRAAAVKKRAASVKKKESLQSQMPKLLDAAKKGRHEKVRELLERGVPVNVQSRGGSTPLLLAAVNGHQSVVDLLIASGADASISNALGDLPRDVAAPNIRWPEKA